MSHTHAGRKSLHHVLCARPDQGQKVQQQGPDISLLSPTLQKQWDHAANAHLDDIVIKPQSNTKASWKCDATPDGHLHTWRATVQNRSNGRGGSQCSGCKGRKHNCLATIARWAAAQWDYEADAALGTPDTVAAYSNKPAGWHCQVCGHKWTVSCDNRVQYRTGCPKPLLKESDHQCNEACGNYSHNTKLKSSKQIFWLCDKCSAGQEHSWSACPSQRNGCYQSGCPVYAGRAACRCNSLQALFPDIAKEWHYWKNQGKLSDYTAGSEHLAWWYSPLDGIWQQTIERCTLHARQRLKNQ